MPQLLSEPDGQAIHSDDVQDIVTAVPSWILRCGISIFFCLILLIICLSAYIQYPDIVKTTATIESADAPKSIIAKTPGKLMEILVNDNQFVKAGTPLAYLESTADHRSVLYLLTALLKIQADVYSGKTLPDVIFDQNTLSKLGELQLPYQAFFQEYLNYRATAENGFYLKKRNFLIRDLTTLTQQTKQLYNQKSIQEQDFKIAGEEYKMHQKLVESKVETQSEFRTAESKYLAKKSSVIQTDASLITANGSFTTKEKEILELDNQIAEDKAKFLQALNSLISQAQEWVSKYVLVASQDGKLTFAGIIQKNQLLKTNQDVFYINSGNSNFFGEMIIPQENMGKIQIGQEVLVKLKSYPFEQFGVIKGYVKEVTDVPYQDSIFMAKVNFNASKGTDMKKHIVLKQGMKADVEIITQNATVLNRIMWNFTKLLKERK